MNSSFIGLVNNAALLLALGLLYDVLHLGHREEKSVFQQISTGLILGFIGIAIMLNPWDFGQGVVFDTRSVLLCISGFFFGTIPLLLAALITSVFRLSIGGTGAWTGVAVIVTSGGIGLVWRHLHRDRKEDPTTGELYLLGIVVHIAMLAWMFSLPWQVALEVLSKITLPVILIYPLATAFLGKLMVNRGKRKRSEEALRASDQDLKESQRIAHVGSWHLDVSSNQVVWSEELYRMYGFDPELPPPPFTEHQKLFTPESWERLSAALNNTKDNGIPYELELETVREDGSCGWMWVHGEAVLNTNGVTIGLRGAAQDITERKRAEMSLKKSQETYRIIAENTADVITTMDMNLRYTYVSPSIIRLRGFTVEESLEQTIDQIMTPDSFQLITNALEEELRLEATATADPDRTRTLELEEYKKDGSTIWVENRSSFIRDKYKKPVGILAVSRDISERRRAESELKELSSHQKTLLSAIPDIVVEVDNHKVYTWANQPGYDFFGDDLIGKEASFYFEGEQHIYEAVQPIFNGEEDVIYLESWQRRKDGEQRLLAWWCNVLKDESGNVMGALSTARDITDQLKIQEQLRQAQKMESIGNLAGGIAHDFNNILSSVIGFTELSLDEVEKGTHLEDNLQEVYTAGKRAKDLVRQILAFARQSEEELKPIQVDTIATEVLKFIRSSIPTTIEIKQNIESDSLIMGNATQVHQILMNLFTNASHAMEDKGGILEFSLKDVVMDRDVNREKLDLKPGNYIEIKVSDTGVGIAPEIIGSIFDPYFTTKDPGEGTGMGLAMVHGIIENYGGKISVDSQLGKGTTFIIYLPITKKRSGQDEYVSEKLPKGKEHILFVDDEASLAKMGGQILERLGYSVTTRTSSVEALELFQTKPNDFDLVVTDMTMPNMTGDKLAVELMKTRQDIPVILCTGYSKKISDEIASEIGIKAFAYKPVVKADLAKTVRKVLDEAKSQLRST
jgi:PAS domain S-box-containing protein